MKYPIAPAMMHFTRQPSFYDSYFIEKKGLGKTTHRMCDGCFFKTFFLV